MNPTKKILALVLAMMLFGSTIGISNVIARLQESTYDGKGDSKMQFVCNIPLTIQGCANTSLLILPYTNQIFLILCIKNYYYQIAI
jgi:hypothetical protein